MSLLGSSRIPIVCGTLTEVDLSFGSNALVDALAGQAQAIEAQRHVRQLWGTPWRARRLVTRQRKSVNAPLQLTDVTAAAPVLARSSSFGSRSARPGVHPTGQGPHGGRLRPVPAVEPHEAEDGGEERTPFVD